MRITRPLLGLTGLALVSPLLAACGGDADLVIYSGRNEELVGGIIEEFEEQEGIEVEVRYGDTAELAAQVAEEGDSSPADVFFSQDAGALGLLSEEGLLTDLSEDDLGRVPEVYASTEGDWVGVTGRVRVIAYDPDQVEESELPDDVAAFTEPEWRGRVAIAPTNASFQTFITAMRVNDGEEAARAFLEGLIANDVEIYEHNLAILDALEAGEVEVGLINHYYLHEKKIELGEENVRTQLKFLPPGTAGALVNVAGVGVLEGGSDNEHADAFVEYLLSDETQAEFVEVTGEYPLVDGVEPPADVPPLEELGGGTGIDLGELSSLDETVDLLTEVGLI
ncbi:iron(III) transport system substrate-binding protein [Nocardioides thalensis]|uniref:Iron(III) transport system substrate-binding protein n=1 Tax=Nocardioides thalensis TaxID=1914755 RepID=A0A853BWS4_9ACTN|nr:extracellular solute-binding protein [Nocardioides thalensis]NYI99688.1 iron(III) transport system substrate-binding protein [Nocardioides thalensis]